MAEVMPSPSQYKEDAEAVAKKDRINVVLEDNPERWLITCSRVPMESNVGLSTQTIEIETEPSLWFRSEKWQEYTEVLIDPEDEDSAVMMKPVYKMAVILMVHYIGR